MEQLTGTAPRADVWFLLEYTGRWGKQALQESSIPDEVKAYLNAQLKLIPHSRLLLIQKDKGHRAGLSFFAALPAVNPPALYRFHLDGCEALLTLDLVQLVAQHPSFESARSEEPLLVSCTNGLRDRCCALHGMATYQALEAAYPGLLWQSTHHGGHRFAANLLHLPYGISYGRLRPDSAPEVVQMALEGRIAFYSYRGRTIYVEPVQAAEALLRRGLGIEGVTALRLQHSQDLGKGHWRVQFATADELYEIAIQRQETGARVPVSCGEEATVPVVEYSLVEHSQS